MPLLNTLLNYCVLLLAENKGFKGFKRFQTDCIRVVILSVQKLGFIFIIFYESRYFLTTIMLQKYYIIQTFCDAAIFAAYITRLERRVLTFKSVARLNISRRWSFTAARNYYVCSNNFLFKNIYK